MSGLRPGDNEAGAIERDEYGHPANIGEVAIEEVEERLGWAVFGGCEGETANFHAFFKHKSDADEYVAWCTKDHDADNWITDPGVAAAAIIGGRIVAANHYDDEIGAGVIARAAGVLGDEAERFKDEAAPKSEPGVRPSETKAIDAALVVQLAKDIITAVESHDTHRMKHIEQYARRIVRVAGGT